MITELSRVLIVSSSTEDSYSQLVTFSAEVEPTVQELKEEFNITTCHHHDCCGCARFRVDVDSVVATLANTYAVRIDVSHNV